MLLNRELSHRVKNSLAVIQAIAQLTLRSTPDPQRFSQAFQGRLRALATAHEMLSDANWSGAEFAQLATQQLAPFISGDATGLRLEGPAVLLHPEIATSLGLVLHELATNASKYGSLSVPNGSVSLSWQVDSKGDPPRVNLVWSEKGGPPVTAPQHRGFGSQLIDHSGILVNQDFQSTGLVCTLQIALFSKPDLETK